MDSSSSIPTDNLFESKIILFANSGLLDNYYRANLNIAQSILTCVQRIEDIYNKEPFTNNLFTTDTNGDSNLFVSETSLHSFSIKMKNLTKTFIENILNLFLQTKESQRKANYRDILDISFFQTFQTYQENYFKNFADYLSVFFWFHDMTKLPSFHYDVTDIIDSNYLDMSTYILGYKNHFLNTNIRQFSFSNFRKYRRIFKLLYDNFNVTSLLNEQLIKFFGETNKSPVHLSFERFLRFSKNINQAISEYLLQLDLYKENVFGDDYLGNNINFSQLSLETALSNVVSNIASCNFIESVEILDGSGNYEVSQIITIESPQTNGFDGTAMVDEIRNGHIRTISIDNFNGGNSFEVGDQLIDQNNQNQNFKMEVDTIKDGVVHGVIISTRGEEFLVGDDSNVLIFKNNDSEVLTDFDAEITDVKGILDSIDISDSVRESYQIGDIIEVIADSNDNHQDDVAAQITVSQIDAKLLINNSLNFQYVSETLTTPTYDEFFQGVKGQIGRLNMNHKDNLQRWVNRTSIYEEYRERGGSIVMYSGFENNAYLTEGGVGTFISYLFTRFPVNSGLQKLAILLLEQMASINSYFDDFIRTTIKNDPYNISNNTISSIESSYSSDPQNIIQEVSSGTATPTSVEFDSNIKFSYGGTKFSMDIESIRFDTADLEFKNVTKLNSQVNDVFYLNWHEDSLKHRMRIKNILVAENSIELVIDSNKNDSNFQVGDTHLPYIDNDPNKTINTTVTSIVIPENSIQIQTDTNRDYNVYWSGLEDQTVTYSGQDLSLNATDLVLDSNTVSVALINPESKVFTIDQTFENVFYANKDTTPITVSINSVLIDSNTIDETILSFDTNDQKLAEYSDITYGNDSNNPISISINKISVEENSLQSKIDIDTSVVDFSNPNLSQAISLYSYGSEDTNDTNYDVQLNLEPLVISDINSYISTYQPYPQLIFSNTPFKFYTKYINGGVFILMFNMEKPTLSGKDSNGESWPDLQINALPLDNNNYTDAADWNTPVFTMYDTNGNSESTTLINGRIKSRFNGAYNDGIWFYFDNEQNLLDFQDLYKDFWYQNVTIKIENQGNSNLSSYSNEIAQVGDILGVYSFGSIPVTITIPKDSIPMELTDTNEMFELKSYTLNLLDTNVQLNIEQISINPFTYISFITDPQISNTIGDSLDISLGGSTLTVTVLTTESNGTFDYATAVQISETSILINDSNLTVTGTDSSRFTLNPSEIYGTPRVYHFLNEAFDYTTTDEISVSIAKEVVNIYVSSGNLESEPYYTFYTNIEGTSELTPINTLSLDKKYIFSRLNNANSHPFYISDGGYNTESTSSILLSGDGSYNSGITGTMKLTLEFNEFDTNDTNNTLYFYCTSHSDMLGEFDLLSGSIPISSSLIRFKSENYDSNEVKIKVIATDTNSYVTDIQILTSSDITITNESLTYKYGVDNLLEVTTSPSFTTTLSHNAFNAENDILTFKSGIDNTLSRDSNNVTGSVIDFSITHDLITAEDSSISSPSLPVSLLLHPQGKINTFSFQINDDITLTPTMMLNISENSNPGLVDSNNDLSTLFQLQSQPTGYQTIVTTHPSFVANDTNFLITSPFDSFISLTNPVTGSILDFTSSNSEMNSIKSYTFYEDNNSPYILRTGSPFGKPITFNTYNTALGSGFIPKSKFDSNYKINVYDYETINGETISYSPTDFEVGYISKPQNYIGTFDTNTIIVEDYGLISDTNTINFEDPNLNLTRDSYNFDLTIQGKLILYSITNQGFGFSNVKDPHLYRYNNNTIPTTLIYENFYSISKGEVYNLVLKNGSKDISSLDRIYVQKTDATDTPSILQPNDIRNGILSSIKITDGGYGHTIDSQFTLNKSDGDSNNNAIIDVASIDNGHIHKITLLQQGSGFSDNSVLNIKGDSIGTVRIQTENKEDRSILCLINDLNSNLDPVPIVEEQTIPRLILSGTLIEINDYSDNEQMIRFKFSDTPTLSGSKSTTEDWPSLPVSNDFSQIAISSTSDWNNPILDINEILTNVDLQGTLSYQTLANNNLYAVLVYFDTTQQASDFYSTVTNVNLINTTLNIDIQNK